MAMIELYPSATPKAYGNAHVIKIDEGGVLTFTHRDASTGVAKKVTTTLPYVIFEDVES